MDTRRSVIKNQNQNKKNIEKLDTVVHSCMLYVHCTFYITTERSVEGNFLYISRNHKPCVTLRLQTDRKVHCIITM